jgi:phosphate transport system substrate-binding protein
MNHGDDNFLYALRTQPSSQFAARLKARLDRQASDAGDKRRSTAWFVFGAILMGGAALAYVSPSVRQASVAVIINVFDSSASEEMPESRAADPRAGKQQGADREGEPIDRGNVANSRAPNVAVSDGSASSAMASVNELTKPVPANGNRSFIGVSDARINTVRIAHSEPLSSLAEGIAVELESRVSNINITTLAVPAGVAWCAPEFRYAESDIVVTDRRLSQVDRDACTAARQFEEVAFAHDAIVIVVNRENTWARAISRSDLRKIGEELPAGPMPTPPTHALTTWNQMRSQWPSLPFTLVGTAIQQSRLGSRFAEVIGMRRNPSTLEVTKDDRATLKVVENSLGAMGYIDFTTLTSVLGDRSALPTVVAITNATGEAVEPNVASIQDGRYELSRPIWVYINANGLRRLGPRTVIGELFESQPPRAIADHGLIPIGRTQRQDALRRLNLIR